MAVRFTYTNETEREQSRRLAEARQALAHEGTFVPVWAELTQDEQDLAMVEARNYVRAAHRCGLITE